MDSRGAFVADTSVLIEGLVSKLISSGDIQPGAIIIPNAAVDELEHQANAGHETGLLGLDELRRLRALCTERDIPLAFKGEQPGQFEIDHAKDGAIDDMIRQLAMQENAVLLTADRVQASVADAIGLPTKYVAMESASLSTTPLDEFFTEETMSVHLKEDAQSVRKVGKPGAWRFEDVGKTLDRNAVQAVAKAIVEQASVRRDSYIETERRGSTIVQLSHYRIVIAKPPFASGWEITAVRPVTRLTLAEYEISAKLQQRLARDAEGILIAGAPGSGKSTFVQALAQFYVDQRKIVKTVEAPRDLVVPKEVTQYSLSHSSGEEIRDVLLLNRPDYTVFDEMRTTDHFKLYTDLRLSGVGMVGVVHATKPIDAIQRFMSRIDLGVIPHVVDTVVFIKDGGPKKVFSVEIKVKVPGGMTEEDLARPVVCISDFETDTLEYEVYTFGEQTMVLPVSEETAASNPTLKLAAQAIKEYFFQFVDKPDVQMTSPGRAIVFVPKGQVAMLIGSGGSRIKEIEAELGLSIDIRERGSASGAASKTSGAKHFEHEEPSRKGKKGKGIGAAASRAEADTDDDFALDITRAGPLGERVAYELEFERKNVVAHLGKRFAGQDVTFYDGIRPLATATVNRNGEVHFAREAPQAVAISYAMRHGELDVRVAS
jgi:ATPase